MKARGGSPSKGPKRLGEILVESGLIDNRALARAMETQKNTKQRLGKILIDMGVADPETIAKAMAQQLNIPLVHLKGVQIPEEVIRLVPPELAENYLLIPLEKTGKRLTVVMADPLEIYALDDLRFVTRMPINMAVAPEGEILEAIEKYYPKQDLEKDLGLKGGLDEDIQIIQRKEVEEKDLEDLQDILALTERPPVVRFTNVMFADALNLRASDIHIEPQKTSVIVRYRIDGIMREIMKTDRHIHASIISRIKVISNMDVTIRRKPQDGKTQIKFRGKVYDLRVSTIPTSYGEKMTIRILNPDASGLGIEDLGLSDRAFEDFVRAMSVPQGIVLVTGPTGSGKSSTLYACLNRLNSPSVNIVTVEDPIEFDMDGINQVQINPQAGITFAAGLRSILRQDPDIVMVGEIRDRETAAIACQAAQTGHLVLSTLHTNDAPSAVTRLLDLGIEPFAIAASLTAVVGQRLVRRLCENCRVPEPLSQNILDRLSPYIGTNQSATFWKGIGCQMCQYSGYSGRLGLFEILTISPTMRELIVPNLHPTTLKRAAEKEGFTPMFLDGITKALQGVTSIEEVFRVSPPEGNDHPSPPLAAGSPESEIGKNEPPPLEKTSSISVARPPKVLVADDNQIVLKILRNLLESENYITVTVENGLEALKAVMRERPDLVITDFLMPEMNGLELIKKLRSQLSTRYIPIIMLTAKNEVDAEVKGIDAGADDYLSKPVNPRRLLARISRLLKRANDGER